jgi:hypothetical protein
MSPLETTMNPRTLVATCTALLAILVWSGAPAAQSEPELTPDQSHAWRLYGQYKGVIGQFDARS